MRVIYNEPDQNLTNENSKDSHRFVELNDPESQVEITSVTDDLQSLRDSPAETSELVTESVPEDLTLQLSEYSFGELQKLLQTLDTEKEGIESTGDLIKYLINNTAKHDYNQADVINMLADYSSHEDVIIFLQKLLNISEGDLHSYLELIDPVKEGIDSKQLLIDKLLKDGENNKIDRQDIISIILRAEALSSEEVLAVLRNLASEKLASNLSDIPDNIITAEGLFRYLIDKSSEKEASDLFSTYLRKLDLYNFHSQLIRNSEGALYTTLTEIDLSISGIKDVRGLIRYLLNNSESGGYSKDDVYDLLGKIAINKNAGLNLSENNLSELVSQSKFRRSIQQTGGLFLVIGIIVFILIIISKRRKKKKEEVASE
jgi:hypothetical protein